MTYMMDRKIEIESKLDKEKANLDLLKQRVHKSSQIAKNIDGILNNFEQRLLRLEDTILPVYNETENLQKSQHNIERTLKLLDNVISYYEVSSKVEDIIEKGPGVVTEPGIDLDLYLESLNNLAKARKYFDKHIPQSVELENVLALYKRGSDQLHKEFKVILDKHSKPILAVPLLNYINAEDDMNLDETQTSMPNEFPPYIRQDLIKIARWLLDNKRDEFLNVYAALRGSVLQKTLTCLKNHQRSVSGGSVHGTAGSPIARPKFQNRHEITPRRSSALKSINQVFQRASQTLGQSTGLYLGPRRSHSQLDTSYLGEDIDNEQEMENYLVCVIALHKLMQLEQHLMQGIVVDPLHQEKVFELIVKESMDSIVQDGENIASRARRCINRHDFSAVLVIFPILKQLLSLKPEFEKTVERNRDSSASIALSKFNTILTTLHNTSVKALDDFIESLRSESVTQLPRDGTVHELTSNVLMFLEHLLDYIEPIGGVLINDQAYSVYVQRLKNVDKNKALLGLYIKKVLVQLHHTLTSKSEQYGDPALKSIFRLNNTNYVLKSLQHNKLLDLYRISEPKCEEYYYTAIQGHKDAYLESWSKLLNYITIDDSSMNLLQMKQFKDKDRSVIKEKFAGFNKEIEDITKVQRGYSIPDVEVRESLKRDNKEFIIPKYNTFYNMFSSTNFTKNPEKYIRFKPDEIATIIDKFFDVSA